MIINKRLLNLKLFLILKNKKIKNWNEMKNKK